MLDLLLLLLSLCRPARLLSWALCLAGVLVLWLAMEKATLRDYIKARARYNSYYEQVQRLQNQQQQYKTELADIKAGGFRLEKTIREECPLIRPGEKVVYIESADDPKAAARPQTPAPAIESTPALPPATEAAARTAPAADDQAPADAPALKKKPTRPADAEAEQAPAETSASAARSGRATKKAAAETVSGKRSGKSKTAAKASAKKTARAAKARKTAPRAAESNAAPRTAEF